MKATIYRRKQSWALTAVLGASLLLANAHAQVEGAIVTKRGAALRGTVEGNLLVVQEDSTVSVTPQANLTGDLVLPAERTVRSPGPGGQAGGAGKPRVSNRARVTVADQTAVKGRQRAARGFALPKAGRLKTAKGDESVVLRNGRDRQPDVSRLKDLTLRNESVGMLLPPRSIGLPPGAYGNIVIESGQLILGVARSTERVQYSFESLSVSEGAGVVLLGPVVITAGQVGALDGTLGSSRYFNWLDLRILSGDAVVNGQIYGHVAAPAGTVTLRSGSWLLGGLVCDQAVVEEGARFTGVRPSWSDEATGNARPTFMQNAGRFETRVAELADEWADQYTIETNYEDDVPTIEVTPVRGGSPKADDELFLEMACALFETTRFDSGNIVLHRPGRAQAITQTLTRPWFVESVRSLGLDENLTDAVGAVRRNPGLRSAFFGNRPANPPGKQ